MPFSKRIAVHGDSSTPLPSIIKIQKPPNPQDRTHTSHKSHNSQSDKDPSKNYQELRIALEALHTEI